MQGSPAVSGRCVGGGSLGDTEGIGSPLRFMNSHPPALGSSSSRRSLGCPSLSALSAVIQRTSAPPALHADSDTQFAGSLVLPPVDEYLWLYRPEILGVVSLKHQPTP